MARTLIFQFFTQLAVGGAWTLLLVPLREAGHGFFRFCGILIASFLTISLWAGPYAIHGVLSHRLQLLTVVLFVLSVPAILIHVWTCVYDRPPWDRRFLFATALLGSTALVADGLLHTTLYSHPWWATILLPASFLASACFLGSVCFAMILGHWYLISPALSIQPLRRVTRLILISLGVKAILLVIGLYLYGFVSEQGRGTDILLGSGAFFVWARVLFGLVGPAVIGAMIWSTVKIHSTQSATGLLYVATVLVLMGELLARYIFFSTSVPV